MALENLNNVYDGIGIPPPEENPFPNTPGVAFNPMATGKITASVRTYNPADYTSYFQAPVYENQGDINLRRGAAQSNWDKTGNAIVQTVGKIGTQLLDMTGGIGSLLTEWGDNRDYKNDFTQAADDSNAWLSKNFPLYRSTNDTFGLSDMSWWLENASGLTASVAGFALGGSAIAKTLGGIGKVSGIGSTLEAGIGTVSELSTARNIVQGAEKTLTAGMLAYSEGAMSGRRVYDEVYSAQLRAGKTDDEAKHIAAQSAATTVQLNTIINTGMNLAGGMDMFFNHEKNKVIDVAKKTFGRRADETAEAWVKRLGEETPNKYARELGTDMGLMGMGKKALTAGREAAAEGIEELTNQFAERTGIEEGKKGKIYGLAEQLGQLSNYFNRTMDKEGALNFVMGAIAGPIQNTAASLAPIHKVETGTAQNAAGELIDEKGNVVTGTDDAAKTYQENKVFKGWTRVSQLQKNKSMTNKFFLDIKDRVVEDAKFLQTTEANIKKAILDGNPLEAERLKEDYFNIMNFNSVALGMGNNLKETYRSIASLDNTKDNTTELQNKVSVLQQSIDNTKAAGGDTTDLDLQLKEAETALTASKGQTAAMKLGFTDSKDNNEYKEKAEKAIQNLEAIQKIHDDTQKKYGFDKELSNLEQGHLADFIFQQKANLYLLEQNLADKQNELSKLDTPEVSSSTVESEFRRQLLREQEIGRQYDRAASRKEKVNADIEIFNAYLKDEVPYDTVEPILRKYGTVSPTPDGINEAVKKTSEKLAKIRDGVTEKMTTLSSSLLETEEYISWAKKNPNKAFADYANDLAQRYQDSETHRQLAAHVDELKTRISTQSDSLAEMTTGKTLDKVLKNTKNYFDKLQKEHKARQEAFSKKEKAAIASNEKRREAIILQQKLLQKKYHKELEQIKDRLQDLIQAELQIAEDIRTVEMLPNEDFTEWNELIEKQKQIKAEIEASLNRIAVLETLYNKAEEIITPPPPPPPTAPPPPGPSSPPGPPGPTAPMPAPSAVPSTPSEPVPSLDDTDDDTDLPDVPEEDPTLSGPSVSTTPMADAYMLVLSSLQAPAQVALETYRKEVTNGAPFSINAVAFALDNKVPKEQIGEIALALRNFVEELGVMLNDISDTVDAATTAMDTDLADVPVVDVSLASLETEGLVVADNSEEEMTLPDTGKPAWAGLKQINPETAGASRSTIYFTKLSNGTFQKLSTPLLDPKLNPKVLDPQELKPGTKVRVRIDTNYDGLVNDTSIDPTQNVGGVKQMESKFEDFLVKDDGSTKEGIPNFLNQINKALVQFGSPKLLTAYETVSVGKNLKNQIVASHSKYDDDKKRNVKVDEVILDLPKDLNDILFGYNLDIVGTALTVELNDENYIDTKLAEKYGLPTKKGDSIKLDLNQPVTSTSTPKLAKEELKKSNPEFFNKDGNISIADMSNDTFIKFMSGVIFDLKDEIGSDSPYTVIRSLVEGLGFNMGGASTLLLAASEETKNYLKEIYNFYQNSKGGQNYWQSKIKEDFKKAGIQKQIDWINEVVTLNNITTFKKIDSLSLDEYLKIKLGFSFLHQYPNQNRIYSDFAFNPATNQTLFRIPSKQVLDDFKKIAEIFAYRNVPEYSEIKENFLKLENFKNLSEKELIDLYNTKNLNLDKSVKNESTVKQQQPTSSRQIDLEKIGNVPIVIEDENGNVLQYLHRVDWVTEQINGESEDNPDRFRNVVDTYTVGDQVIVNNVARAAAELTNIRRALVQQFNNGNTQGIETVVKEKSPGQLVLTNKPQSALVNLGADSNIQLAFVKDEKTLAGGIDSSLLTNTNFSEVKGRTVALIPAANGQFIPTVLTSQTLGNSPRDKQTFIRAIELLLNPVQEEVDFIKETSGFDVSTNQGFRDYILQYFTYFTTEASFMSNAGFGMAIDSQGFIQGKPKVVIMIKGEGIVNSIPMEVDDSGVLTEESYSAISNFLNSRHRAPALTSSKFKGLNNNEKFTAPFYVQGKWMNSEHKNYNKFLLWNMETKVTFAKNAPADSDSGVKTDELGRTSRVYRFTVNPIVQYSLDSVLSSGGDLTIADDFVPLPEVTPTASDESTLVFDTPFFDLSLDSKVQSVGTNDKPSMDIKSLEKLFTFTPQNERNGKTPLEIFSYYRDIGVTHLPDGLNPFRKC